MKNFSAANRNRTVVSGGVLVVDTRPAPPTRRVTPFPKRTRDADPTVNELVGTYPPGTYITSTSGDGTFQVYRVAIPVVTGVSDAVKRAIDAASTTARQLRDINQRNADFWSKP